MGGDIPAGLRLQTPGEEAGPQEAAGDHSRCGGFSCSCGSADRTAGLAFPLWAHFTNLYLNTEGRSAWLPPCIITHVTCVTTNLSSLTSDMSESDSVLLSVCSGSVYEQTLDWSGGRYWLDIAWYNSGVRCHQGCDRLFMVLSVHQTVQWRLWLLPRYRFRSTNSGWPRRYTRALVFLKFKIS